MGTLTTIQELSKKYLLSQTRVREIFSLNEIKPVLFKKTEINGVKAYPYNKAECEKALKAFTNKRNDSTERKIIGYNHSFICKILRPHNVNSLSGKLVSQWTSADWTAFENLKNEKLKSIQVNY